MPDARSLDAMDTENLSFGAEASGGHALVQVDPKALERELEALYRSHFGKVVGYFRRCGMDDAIAHDLTQDTFVNALRGLPNFKGQSKLSTWLWTIARNVLLAFVRTHPATRNAEEPVDPDTLTNGADEHLNDMCDCIRRGFAAFARAHPERAQVLYLAAVEGWSIKELAEFLGRTPHAATEYLSQCRAKLKPFIVECGDDCE